MEFSGLETTPHPKMVALLKYHVHNGCHSDSVTLMLITHSLSSLILGVLGKEDLCECAFS